MKKLMMMVAVLSMYLTASADFTCSTAFNVDSRDSSVKIGTVTWKNTSSTGIAAPYVRVTAGDGVLIRFTDADAWAKSIEFLATSAITPASTLKANESGSLSFSCQSDSDDGKLELSWTLASGEAFPWSEIGASLKPSYVTDAAWTFALATLKSRLGTTWDSYLDRLRDNADYLAGLGRPVNRLDRLLQVEINAALGVDAVLPVLASVTDAARLARGLGLSFTRSYSSAMVGRFKCGILGYGWTDNLSTYAELMDDETLVFHTPGGGSYAFTKATGSWQPEDARDKSVLAESSSAYTLTYQSGTVQTFAKSNMRTASIADNSGNKLTFTWSGTTLQNIAHTDGQSLTFGYSGGLLASVTDDYGRETRYTYSDSLLTKVTAPDGLETLYEYRAADGTAVARALSRITYFDGTTREYSYDTSSGLVSAVSVNGGKEKTTISRNGLNVTLTGPDGAATTLSLGVSGEVLKTTDALGGVATNGYTEDGLLKSVVSPSGLTGSISHDALGRVGKSVSANGAETAFAYEETFGNLKTVTDANGHAVTYGYDEQGRGKSVTFADGSSSTIEYNDRGDVLKSTNRRGQSISYEYDSQGRIKKKTWSNGRTFAYAYDEEGNLVAASDSETGQVSMYYIVGGRLRCIFYPNGRAIFYDYDSETGKVSLRKHGKATVTGRPQSPNPEYEIWQEEFKLEYDEDSEEVFAYDASGRLASVADGNGNFYLKNTYDATTGRLSKQENGNGTSVSYLYDKLGRVVSIEHRGADGNIAESLLYCYDADGRCIRAASLFGEERYTYDKDGQLTAVDYPDIADETFAYDAVGNRKTANGATYSVNNLNQYTAVSGGPNPVSAITYDRDGNLTSLTDANGTTTYTYDTLNRLVAVTNATAGIDWSCTYDVFGNRVSVTDNGVTTERIYLQGSLPSVAAEYVNGELKERHIVVGAVRIADVAATPSSSRYYHSDLIGSTRLVTDDSGAIVDRRAYKAFGETRVGGDSDTSVGYVGTLGVETDSTGLLFMRNRYYSPALGRFIQMDPIGLNGGDVNWYRYCRNKPLFRVDVTGCSELGLIFDAIAPDVHLWAKTMDTSLTAASIMDSTFKGDYEGASIKIFKAGISSISVPVKLMLTQWDILMAQMDDYNEELGLNDTLDMINGKNLNLDLSSGYYSGHFRENKNGVVCDIYLDVPTTYEEIVKICSDDGTGGDPGDDGSGSGGSDDIPSSVEISVPIKKDGDKTGISSKTVTVNGSFTISFEAKMSPYNKIGQASSCILFYVDGVFKCETLGQSWVKHSINVSGDGDHVLEWRVKGVFKTNDLFLKDQPITGYVRNIEITRLVQAANVVKAASIAHEVTSSLKTTITAAAVKKSVVSNGNLSNPRLYCYERYVAVKDFNYAFVLSADDDATISVSDLPSGFAFADGEIRGYSSAVGTKTITITAKGSEGTTTKQVPFVVIDLPECWKLDIPETIEPTNCDIGFCKGKTDSKVWTDSLFVTTMQGGTSPMTSLAQGSPVYLYYGFKNLAGDFDVTGFINRFTLNTGATFDKPWTNSTLHAGKWGWGGKSWTPSALQNLPPGTYTLTCTLDARNDLAETDEGNNTKTITFSVVTPVYDMGFSPLSHRGYNDSLLVTSTYGGTTPMTSIAQGAPIYLYYGFKNLAGDFDMKNFVNRFTLNTGVTFDDSWSSYTLYAGNWGWGGITYRPSALQDLAPGTYTLTCMLDATDRIAETNEGNNMKSITFSIVASEFGSGGGSVKPTATPSKEIVKPWTATKAVTVNGAMYDTAGNVVGVVQLKIAKPNTRKKTTKVSGYVMSIDGKKVTLKANSVNVSAIAPMNVTATARSLGTLTIKIGDDGFSGKVGNYTISTANVGGNWTRTNAKVYVATTILPDGTLKELLPYGELILVKGGKWVFNKGARVKLSKDNSKAEWDTSGGKSNLSSLKLTYTPKTGLFKGSFKVYVLESATGGKKRLKKYTANVTGVVVDGKGYGQATIRKPAAGPWAVTVK